jgi:hypothetical protein
LSETSNANITVFRDLKIDYTLFGNCKILQLNCGRKLLLLLLLLLLLSLNTVNWGDLVHSCRLYALAGLFPIKKSLLFVGGLQNGSARDREKALPRPGF